jgi:hypothetical protein
MTWVHHAGDVRQVAGVATTVDKVFKRPVEEALKQFFE